MSDSSPALEELYASFANLNMEGGWHRRFPALWPEPRENFVPHVWHYGDVKPILDIMCAIGAASRRRSVHSTQANTMTRPHVSRKSEYRVKAPLTTNMRSEILPPRSVVARIKLVDDYLLRHQNMAPGPIVNADGTTFAPYRVLGVGLACGRYEIVRKSGLLDSVRIA